MKRMMAALGGLALALAAPAYADTLTTGTGDGQVVLNVDAFGRIVSNGALYNPVGTGTAASTIFDSRLYYRNGATGARQSMGVGSLLSFTGDTTSRTSLFTLSGLDVTLTQSVASLFDNNVQTGSQLTQSYTFTNRETSATTLDLVRYLDGDLLFDGSLTDGGGFLTSNGTPLLFEIDSATGASTASTFLGIYNTGGTQNGYQILNYNTLQNQIAAGDALANTIQGDIDPVDGFIDAGRGYDVTLGLGSLLDLAAGGSATFNTVTLFGSGAPGGVVVPPPTPAVPEPAAWAMMIAGFAVAGGALRRRRGTASRALRAA